MHKTAHALLGFMIVCTLFLFVLGLNLKQKNVQISKTAEPSETNQTIIMKGSTSIFETTPIEELGEGEAMYYITNAYSTDDGNYYVVLDAVQFFRDVEYDGTVSMMASKACLADGHDCFIDDCDISQNLPCMPDGYYVRNVNPLYLTYQVDSSVEIEMSPNYGYGQELPSMSLEEFVNTYNQDPDYNNVGNSLYLVGFDDDTVYSLSQFYTP